MAYTHIISEAIVRRRIIEALKVLHDKGNREYIERYYLMAACLRQDLTFATFERMFDDCLNDLVEQGTVIGERSKIVMQQIYELKPELQDDD